MGFWNDQRAIVCGGLCLAIIALGVANLFSYYYLGTQEKIAQLEAGYRFINKTLTNNSEVNKLSLETAIQGMISEEISLTLSEQDVAEYTKNRAWSIAKYTLLKTIDQELKEGSDFGTARAKGLTAAVANVTEYYQRLMNNTVNQHNEHVMNMEIMIDGAAAKALGIVASQVVAMCEACAADPNCTPKYGAIATGIPVADLPNQCSITAEGSANIDDCTGTLSTHIGFSCPPYSGGVCCSTPSETTELVQKSYSCQNMSGIRFKYYLLETCYDAIDPWNTEQNLTKALNAYCRAYGQVKDNLFEYAQALTQQIFETHNLTEIIDPITLATLINNGYNETGYYGFAAAELALLGLPTNLTSTVCVDINGTEVCGILFTDWNGTLERGKTYYADPNYLWYILTLDGYFYDISGDNFTVTDLRDYKGNPLNSTSFIKYVDHSGDIAKIWDEMLKMKKLYEEYLDMLATIQAQQAQEKGFFDQIMDWWNSLTTEQKILIVGGGAIFVLIIAYILRGGGKTAVVVAGG